MTPLNSWLLLGASSALTGYGFCVLYYRPSLFMVFMTSCSASLTVRALFLSGVSQ